MRLAIWTYTGAVCFAAIAVASLGGLYGNIFQHWLGGKPLPVLTQFLIANDTWALAIPVPWLCLAVWLSCREVATPPRVFAFAGVSTLAITFLFGITTIAFAMPFMSIVVSLQK